MSFERDSLFRLAANLNILWSNNSTHSKVKQSNLHRVASLVIETCGRRIQRLHSVFFLNGIFKFLQTVPYIRKKPFSAKFFLNFSYVNVVTEMVPCHFYF